MFYYSYDMPQVKWNLISSIKDFVKDLPQKFPHKLIRLRILRNQEILVKS